MPEFATNISVDTSGEEKHQPLFSVLIANYNNGKYLMEAIESVRQQTYSNWEIILVDDGSTDNSVDLYKALQNDERIHIFYNNENKGCGFTKRRCVELAKGKLCGFLDADDALTTDALQVMVLAHANRADAGLIHSRYYETTEYMQVQGVSTEQGDVPAGSSFLEIGGMLVSHFSTFKKNVYDKTEGISPKYKRAIDRDLYYKLEEVAPIAFIDKPLYFYRTGTGKNISLGENGYKAFSSEILIMADAAKRRGLDVETIVSNRLTGYIEDLVKEVELSSANKVRNSWIYKVGKFLLEPFRLFRTMIK